MVQNVIKIIGIVMFILCVLLLYMKAIQIYLGEKNEQLRRQRIEEFRQFLSTQECDQNIINKCLIDYAQKNQLIEPIDTTIASDCDSDACGHQKKLSCKHVALCKKKPKKIIMCRCKNNPLCKNNKHGKKSSVSKHMPQNKLTKKLTKPKKLTIKPKKKQIVLKKKKVSNKNRNMHKMSKEIINTSILIPNNVNHKTNVKMKIKVNKYNILFWTACNMNSFNEETSFIKNIVILLSKMQNSMIYLLLANNVRSGSGSKFSKTLLKLKNVVLLQPKDFGLSHLVENIDLIRIMSQLNTKYAFNRIMIYSVFFWLNCMTLINRLPYKHNIGVFVYDKMFEMLDNVTIHKILNDFGDIFISTTVNDKLLDNKYVVYQKENKVSINNADASADKNISAKAKKNNDKYLYILPN